MISEKKQNNKKTGFTIVETLVAIFILLLSVTGPMAVAQGGLRSAYIARDQTTAFYLAQDAIEYIKNIRDDNFISASDWLDGLENCVGDDVWCTIDTTESTPDESVETCPWIGCSIEETLRINENDQFGFSGSVTSTFYRKINIQEKNQNNEATVTITIGWRAAGNPPIREITVVESIFRWWPLYHITSSGE